MYAVDGETAYRIKQDIKILKHLGKEYTMHMTEEYARDFERTVTKRD